ncbi:hypothetical protein [Kitasatospora sp. NPDC059800]|uniref:hypothetical protein n=1 Tax=Kitasatospora sp. NPDC059800 TaxID=3346951 RepID=UPI00365B1F6A
MVEVTLTLRVCNVCKRPGVPVERYTLAHGARKAEVDLCGEHAGVVEDLMATVESAEEPSTAAPEGQGGVPVRPVVKKAAAKKTTAKKAAAASGATAAKKATRRRGAQVLTIEEIEKLRHQ